MQLKFHLSNHEYSAAHIVCLPRQRHLSLIVESCATLHWSHLRLCKVHYRARNFWANRVTDSAIRLFLQTMIQTCSALRCQSKMNDVCKTRFISLENFMKINSYKPRCSIIYFLLYNYIIVFVQGDTFVTEHSSLVAEIRSIHDVYADGFLTAQNRFQIFLSRL